MTDTVPPDTRETVIHVDGTPGYDVIVRRGARHGLRAALPPEAKKVLIVHQPTLGRIVNDLRDELIADGDLEVLLAEIPDAESAKRVEVASFLWGVLGQADFTRTDAIVGFGGGAATDLAGFAAATWLRGIDVVQVPTTVLGMVDASVGGKTGINTAEGKNLVGAFWAPRAVLCDLEILEPLPDNEKVAGFAEVVKAGFIRYPEILEIVERDPQKAIDVTSAEFRRCIELAIQMKADVVGEDFREAGLRETLNYGHTLGHAIEHAERYKWRHGAAISIGMMFAAELSRLAGRLSDDAVDRHRSILESLGLPTTYRAGAWKQLLATMQRDKKARAGQLRFIVLDDVGKPAVLHAPDQSLLFAAYQEVAEEQQGGIIQTGAR
ncbi:3-dehydroquinate synthase [Microbacterium amylolyticum]|uniref:3-dehydroquinate synthase n=1 Tax=Microbacterium amylolyticum TaxID=936337 RepID=A0ABS4ZE33_9MICO|nr:3-dehydroquinate synthase [Microbacterium amylolyticum]MBP2435535.1 3-dehydroquinate synthase [Microbacterium amylolyticum]